MAELLEQIKKMSRAEQLVLAQQIWDLGHEGAEVPEEDPEFREELQRRVQQAIDNPHAGIPWEQVKTQMLQKLRERGA